MLKQKWYVTHHNQSLSIFHCPFSSYRLWKSLKRSHPVKCLMTILPNLHYSCMHVIYIYCTNVTLVGNISLLFDVCHWNSPCHIKNLKVQIVMTLFIQLHEERKIIPAHKITGSSTSYFIMHFCWCKAVSVILMNAHQLLLILNTTVLGHL